MDEELNSSILGSYEFWNNLYYDEIENFKDHGDVGEIWFGKETSKKIIEWVKEKSTIQKDDAILDLGCGNGMFLIDLHKNGFTNLHGVDYSKNAVDLASAIAQSEQCSINFFVCDIVSDVLPLMYDVVFDKGTYDAISLDPEDSKSKRQTYIKNVNHMLKENGLFIITSCNWTDSELQQQFTGLTHLETLPAPCFTFGGRVGKTVSTVVFKKSSSEAESVEYMV